MIALLMTAALAQTPPLFAPTADPLPEPSCGALSDLPLGDVTTMLGDRLHLQLTPAATRAELPHDVMAAPVAEDNGALFFLESGTDRMGLVLNNTFQSAPKDMDAAARAYLSDLPAQGAPWNLAKLPVTGGQIQAWGYWPHQLIVDGDNDVWALGVLFITPDNTVLHASFRLDSTTATHGLGCTALAAKLVATATPGASLAPAAAPPLRMTVPDLGTLVLQPPANATVVPQPGPDFLVWYVVPRVDLNVSPASMGIYIGAYPQDLEATNLPPVKGRLLGKKGAWSASLIPDGLGGELHRLERRIELVKESKDQAPLYLHLFISAPDEAQLDSLRKSAESLSWEK